MAVDLNHLKAMQEVSKFEGELKKEQEKYQMEMNQRKASESKIKEDKIRAENEGLALSQGGRKLVERLEC